MIPFTCLLKEVVACFVHAVLSSSCCPQAWFPDQCRARLSELGAERVVRSFDERVGRCRPSMSEDLRAVLSLRSNTLYARGKRKGILTMSRGPGLPRKEGEE